MGSIPLLIINKVLPTETLRVPSPAPSSPDGLATYRMKDWCLDGRAGR